MWEKESESEKERKKERKKECEQAQNRILKRPRFFYLLGHYV